MDIQTYKLMMGVAGASTDEPQDHFYLHINHGSSLQSTTHNGWEQVKTGYSNDLTKMGGITFDHDNNVYIQYGIKNQNVSASATKGEWRQHVMKLNDEGTYQWVKYIERSGFPGNDVSYQAPDYLNRCTYYGNIFSRTNSAGTKTVIYAIVGRFDSNNDFYWYNTGGWYENPLMSTISGFNEDGTAGWSINPSAGTGGTSTLTCVIGPGERARLGINLHRTHADDMDSLFIDNRSSYPTIQRWMFDDESATSSSDRLLQYPSSGSAIKTQNSTWRFYYNSTWSNYMNTNCIAGSGLYGNSNTATSSDIARMNNCNWLGFGSVASPIRAVSIHTISPYSATDSRMYQDTSGLVADGAYPTNYNYMIEPSQGKINNAKSELYDNAYCLVSKWEGTYNEYGFGGCLRWDTNNVKSAPTVYQWFKYSGGSSTYNMRGVDLAFDSSGNVYGLFSQIADAGGGSVVNTTFQSAVLVKWNDGSTNIDWIRRIQIWKNSVQYSVRPGSIKIDNGNRLLIMGDHQLATGTNQANNFTNANAWVLKVKWDGDGVGTWGASGAFQIKYENPGDISTTTIANTLQTFNTSTNAISSRRYYENNSGYPTSPRTGGYLQSGNAVHGNNSAYSTNTTTTDLGNY